MAIEGPHELDSVLTRRAHEKAVAQQRRRAIYEAIDGDGQVTVFDLATQRPVRLWPVDAAELILSGTAVLPGSEPARDVVTIPVPSPAPEPPGTPAAKPPAKSKGRTKPGAAAGEPPAEPPTPETV